MRLDDPGLELAELLSAPLRDDETGVAIAKSVTPALRAFLSAVRNISLLGNVRNLPDRILDELAWELNVPWYDAGVGPAVKREAIRSSDRVNMRLGTPWAVATVAAMYFGASQVEEWWEYGADPYHFRVRTANLAAATNNSALFRELVRRTKNVRSVFDGVIVNPSAPNPVLYAGYAIQTVRKMTVPVGFK